MSSQGPEQTDLSPAMEVADRAGSLVTDHVRGVIDTAQARADELERDTAKALEQLRSDADDAANEALPTIDAASERLRALVSTLREDAGSVTHDRG